MIGERHRGQSKFKWAPNPLVITFLRTPVDQVFWTCQFYRFPTKTDIKVLCDADTDEVRDTPCPPLLQNESFDLWNSQQGPYTSSFDRIVCKWYSNVNSGEENSILAMNRGIVPFTCHPSFDLQDFWSVGQLRQQIPFEFIILRWNSSHTRSCSLDVPYRIQSAFMPWIW